MSQAQLLLKHPTCTAASGSVALNSACSSVPSGKCNLTLTGPIAAAARASSASRAARVRNTASCCTAGNRQSQACHQESQLQLANVILSGQEAIRVLRELAGHQVVSADHSLKSLTDCSTTNKCIRLLSSITYQFAVRRWSPHKPPHTCFLAFACCCILARSSAVSSKYSSGGSMSMAL